MSLRQSARTEVRRNQYKVAVDADKGRRQRENNMDEIKKNKREHNLLKKTQVLLNSQPLNAAGVPAQSFNVEKKMLVSRDTYYEDLGRDSHRQPHCDGLR
nr:importin subunit alpha-2-like [Tanacetum cinerariifolium]